MFEDLMTDIYGSFAERFMKAQLVVEPPRPAAPPPAPGPRKRYNALGILEEVAEETAATAEVAAGGDGAATTGTEAVLDVGPAEPPKSGAATRRDPLIVGAGSTRSLAATPAGAPDWSNVGRNDPCPCGSGRKFKKCHGASL